MLGLQVLSMMLVLKMFSLYHRTIEQNLFAIELGQEGIKPYILRGKGYPLLSWLMVPHKQTKVHQTMLKTLYNQQLSCGRSVVEYSFRIFKKMSREFLLKTNLNILFLPDVVCCYMT
jgi:hypothetical protein